MWEGGVEPLTLIWFLSVKKKDENHILMGKEKTTKNLTTM